jgi:CBS domain-containing protein
VSETVSVATAVRHNLRDEKIRVLSRHEPIAIESGSSLKESIRAMQRAKGDCVLICRGGALIGIFTERDVLLKVLAQDVNLTRPIDEFMTPDPDTLTLDHTVQEALEMMERGGYRNIPLTDGSGQLTGIVRNHDIVEYVAEAFPQEVLNLPPRPHQKMEEPEGA